MALLCFALFEGDFHARTRVLRVGATHLLSELFPFLLEVGDLLCRRRILFQRSGTMVLNLRLARHLQRSRSICRWLLLLLARYEIRYFVICILLKVREVANTSLRAGYFGVQLLARRGCIPRQLHRTLLDR